MVNTVTFSQMNIENTRSDKLTHDLRFAGGWGAGFGPVSVVLDDTLYDANMEFV